MRVAGFFGEFRGIFGATLLGVALGIRARNSSLRSAAIASSSPALRRGLEGLKNKKKKPGAGKKGACEKGPVWGHKKRPHPRQKGPGRWASVGPWPHWQQNMPTKSQKGGVHSPRARGAPLALTRARGWGDPLYPLRCDHLLGFSRQSVAAKRKGEKKNKASSEEAQKTLAASRPKKRASEGASEQAQAPLVQGESQNRAGPRMAPRKNAKKRDARPKRAEQTKAAGHKKEKEPERQVRVRGCPVTT